MPVRTSSKLPTSHPLSLPVINPSSLTTYWVKSISSGANPVYLSVPQGSDLNGRRFTAILSGRYTVSTGASGHTVTIRLYAKNGTAAMPGMQINIPAGLTNAPYPFTLRQVTTYDSAAQLIHAYIDYFIGNSASSYQSAIGATLSPTTNIAPSDLNFSAALALTGAAAPTSATFEVFEFVLS
jgi:hypothetical protein